MTKRDGERTRWTDEMLDELADSVSARQAEIAEIRQRQEESDKRFEVLLSEVRYLIRQIKPGD